MSFLTPAFLLGLGALTIPVLVHLIQRERKHLVYFPSLMFLRRIPYQSVRRRRIRHWFLLAMRAAALAMIVAAFARPFIAQSALAVSATGGAREVVILLDQSASMGYGDHWARARAAAHQAVDAVGVEDRATLVLFARNAEENIRATSDRVRLDTAIEAARVGSGATRYGPALKLAQSILSQSSLKRHEAILISDFQKVGWTGAEDVHFPEGTVVTPVSVASPGVHNVAVTSATFARAVFSGQERVTVTGAVVNRSETPLSNVAVTLEIDGHQIETQHTNLSPNAPTTVAFAPFTLAEANARGTVKVAPDDLPQDDAFTFVLAPGRPVSVLVVEQGNDAGSSLFLSKALAIGSAPAFEVEVVPVVRVTPASFDKRTVVILNDTVFPTAAANGVLQAFVERGGGLFIALGERSGWPSTDTTILPGRLGAMVDRATARGGSLGYLDFSHPVFELFKAPRSGDFTGARIFRYRSLEPAATDRVLARFDDGAVAAAERRVGAGRVIAWSSTLDDSWNDLPLKPVFLPLVHRMVRYLSRYEDTPSWYTVGQALDVAAATPMTGKTERVALTPSGRRVPITSTDRPGFLELDEQGFYELRAGGTAERRPFSVAVNLEPSESDLAPMDPAELVAAVMGHAAPTPTGPGQITEVTPADAERRQGIWWYLLLAGLLLLAAEMVVANRLSLNERFL